MYLYISIHHCLLSDPASFLDYSYLSPLIPLQTFTSTEPPPWFITHHNQLPLLHTMRAPMLSCPLKLHHTYPHLISPINLRAWFRSPSLPSIISSTIYNRGSHVSPLQLDTHLSILLQPTATFCISNIPSI